MPTGVSSWNQLLGSTRRRTQGSVAKVLAKVYYAFQAAEAGMMQSMLVEDHEETRKGAYCLGQLANTYAKLADSELSSKLDEVLRLKAAALANGRQTTGTMLLEPPDDDGDETEM